MMIPNLKNTFPILYKIIQRSKDFKWRIIQ